MAERKQGPPDLRKKFVPERTGKIPRKKKVDEQEPEEINQEEEDPLGDDGLLDEPQYQQQQPPQQYQQQQPPQQYVPPQPQYQPTTPPPPPYGVPNTAYTPPPEPQYQEPQPQPSIQLQQLEYQIATLNKMMALYKKYLIYHRKLLEDTEATIEEVAEVSSGIKGKLPEQNLPKSQPLPTLADETKSKKRKRIAILIAVFGIVMLLAAFYLGAIEENLPVTAVVAIFVSAAGGGLAAYGLKG